MGEPAGVARSLANPGDIDAAFSLMLAGCLRDACGMLAGCLRDACGMLAGLLAACSVAVPQGE
jgi:hypothetical protein